MRLDGVSHPDAGRGRAWSPSACRSSRVALHARRESRARSAATSRYHALFLFSMNVLVLAPNLLQLFAGWELVGLTSYLLIGFYFDKPERRARRGEGVLDDQARRHGLPLRRCSSSTSRTGGFALGRARSGPTVADRGHARCSSSRSMGKSAQFPLHVWLPDAMEGPTPVSALLHAATMVAAGVFLVVRADPLFAQAHGARDGDALGRRHHRGLRRAASRWCRPTSRRCSRTPPARSSGYMVAALGAGSPFAGFFHLGTHAFFKALLFLGAGSVIHAVHSNEIDGHGRARARRCRSPRADVRHRRPLARRHPAASPASSARTSSSTALEGKAGWIPWALLLATAFLTAFYMGRVLVLAFLGKPSAEGGARARVTGGDDRPAGRPGDPRAWPAGFLGPWLARGLRGARCTCTSG